MVSIAVEPGGERGEGLRRRSRERGLAIEPMALATDHGTLVLIARR